MGSRVTANVHLKMESEMVPLDYQAFNKFHHGGKVREQDRESLKACLEAGKMIGRKTSSLEQLINLASKV